jgi:hypothetical protein
VLTSTHKIHIVSLPDELFSSTNITVSLKKYEGDKCNVGGLYDIVGSKRKSLEQLRLLCKSRKLKR